MVTPLPEHAVVLLVEDREDDILLIRRAFDKAGLSNPVQVVRDGEEAIEYLSGIGKYSSRGEYPLPDLILLDLKMPKLDGFQVLTSSDQLRDVNRAYQLGANSFLVKPNDFGNSVELARLLREYWMATVKFPETFRSLPKPKDSKKQV